MIITTKYQLKEVLDCDSHAFASQNESVIRRLFHNMSVSPMGDQRYVWLYIKTLRCTEFYKYRYSYTHGMTKFFVAIGYMCVLSKLRRLSYKTGFQIPPFVCGKGLTIWHFGAIIINESTVIGDNCTLYPGVLIGHKEPGSGCPVIGNNVFIGSGAKIIGPVHIGDNVTIGQNCVITEDVPSGAKVVNYHCAKVL